MTDTYLDSSKNGEQTGIKFWYKILVQNIASSEIGKFSPAYFTGISYRFPDGNALKNILVNGIITAG